MGASRIIAVDTNPGKESWAKKFGATEFVNPAQLPEGVKSQDHLVEITDGGLDYTFDCTGNVRCSCAFKHMGSLIMLPIRCTSCGQLLRLVTKDGVFRLSSAWQLLDRRSLPARKSWLYNDLTIY